MAPPTPRLVLLLLPMEFEKKAMGAKTFLTKTISVLIPQVSGVKAGEMFRVEMSD